MKKKSVHVLVIFFLLSVLSYCREMPLVLFRRDRNDQVLTDLDLSEKDSNVMCSWGHTMVFIIAEGIQ